MAKCMGNQFPINGIDTHKNSDFEEWAKEKVYRQGGDGGAKKGKESGVDKGEEEYVMSEIDEIGGVTDDQWKTPFG